MRKAEQDDDTIYNHEDRRAFYKHGVNTYGKDKVLYMRGIAAGIAKWENSGEETRQMKKQYGGQFVEGVKDGERLAVYTGKNFEIDSFQDEDRDSRFTFSK